MASKSTQLVKMTNAKVPKGSGPEPSSKLWNISEIGQGTSLQTLSKRSSGPPGPSNMSPRENSTSKVCVQLAQARNVTAHFPCGWPGLRLMALTCPSQQASRGHKTSWQQHCHLLWVWGKVLKHFKAVKRLSRAPEDWRFNYTQSQATLFQWAFFLGG